MVEIAARGEPGEAMPVQRYLFGVREPDRLSAVAAVGDLDAADAGADDGAGTDARRVGPNVADYLCKLRHMRTTFALVNVAAALLAEPGTRYWGYELGKRAGVRSGVLYPMLTRMLNEGWLSDGWEDPATIAEKRPPRRYYLLTDEGKRQLGALLVRARSDTRFASLNLGWA